MPELRRAGRLVVWLLVAFCWLAVAAPVLAHANITSSEPAPGAVLPAAPAAVILNFSEDLDPTFSRVDLLDAAGQTVVPGPGAIAPGAPRTLRLALPDLAPGSYSARWRARSAADGHITQGTIGFAVGVAYTPASSLPPPGTPDPALALPSAVEVLVHWWSYLAAALAAGSLFFGFLVWQPVQQRMTGRSTHDLTPRRLQHLSLTGLLALCPAVLAEFGVQAWQVAAGAPGTPVWRDLLSTYSGLVLPARLLLALALLWLVWRAPGQQAAGAAPRRMPSLVAALLLVTFSLRSHLAGLDPPFSILIDWLHILAMAAWFGGLPALAILLPEAQGPWLLPTLRRFSALALGSVVVLAVSGVYAALGEVRTPEALLGTSYGRALILKLFLFGLLIAAGAANRGLLLPGLAAGRQGLAGVLNGVVRSETVLGGLVLLAVAVMASLAPAYAALQASHEQGFMQTARVDNVTLTLRIAPLRLGDNEFAVDVRDPRPGADQVPAQVLLRLTMDDPDMGVSQITAQSQDGTRYSVRGSYLSMLGPWQIQVILRRPGFDDIKAGFDLNLAR